MITLGLPVACLLAKRILGRAVCQLPGRVLGVVWRRVLR